VSSPAASGQSLPQRHPGRARHSGIRAEPGCQRLSKWKQNDNSSHLIVAMASANCVYGVQPFVFGLQQVSISIHTVKYCSLSVSGQIQDTKPKMGQMGIPGEL